MPRRKRVYDDDDGRTIADMSGISGPSMFVPRTTEPRKQHPEEAPKSQEPQMDRTERRLYIFGALRAALLIAACYGVVFGVAIAIMIAIWKL